MIRFWNLPGAILRGNSLGDTVWGADRVVLDVGTLRVAFAVVALTLFVLFYAVTFRSTRSAYSGWWCAALVLFLTGAAGYLLDGTPHQVWANPLANSLLVAGSAGVWAAARSLRQQRINTWQLLAAPALTAVASALDNPAVNDWSGGPVFLAMMCVMFSFSYLEMRALPSDFSNVQGPLTAASGLLALFYLGRWLVFLVDGPRGPTFLTFFGSEITTLVTMALLMFVSFGMAAMSTEQLTKDLSLRASRDGLTGLLNRSGFLELAGDELRRIERSGRFASLIIADLDHFKAVNDEHGHSAGDSALQAFAAACTGCVRSTDLVARYGGEEFVILLPGAGPDLAEAIAKEIGHRLKIMDSPDLPRLPTASFGIAVTGIGTADLGQTIAAADAALYQAKAMGRNRVVRATD